MTRLEIESTSVNDLVDAISTAVAAKLRPLVERASAPTPASSGRRLVDGREMSAILTTSESTTARLTASGAIPSIKIGTSRRYDVDAVLSVLGVDTEDRREVLLSQLLDVCTDDAMRERVRAAMGGHER